VIAIVDDDQSVRDGMVDLMTAMGFDAEAFGHAEHFLRSSRLDRTSFLITDMRMPGINGLELHDRLVRSGKRIPTVVITAYPTEPERTRALHAGVIRYLAKPVDENTLVDCIKSSIGARTDRRQP
jgi:FixJ family two-component response regulator